MNKETLNKLKELPGKLYASGIASRADAELVKAAYDALAERPNSPVTDEQIDNAMFAADVQGYSYTDAPAGYRAVVRSLLAAAAPQAQAVEPAADPRPLFDRKLADLQQRGYEVIGRILHKDGQYALFDSSCRWLTQPQYWRLMHEQDGSLFATPAAPAPYPTRECAAEALTPTVAQVGTIGHTGEVAPAILDACAGAAVAAQPQPVAERKVADMTRPYLTPEDFGIRDEQSIERAKNYGAALLDQAASQQASGPVTYCYYCSEGYSHSCPAHKPASQQAPDDRRIADTVNAARDIAIKFHDHQSLRERLAAVLVPVLRASQLAKE